ncbi:MAG: LysR family transcriptional regulator [Clostridiaceae bacterium]|nr:LysR family transcriptional regulator [Clostridiaceae bacterium]
MLNYEEMQYFVAFAKIGTLSDVAEQCNISQPTITRAMKKAETEFGVPLFDRTKNSIKLNDNGTLAAEELSLILKQTDEMVRKIRAYDRVNRTISIGSGAAIQLPELVRRLTEAYPDKPISTELKKPPELLDGLEKNIYQLIILPFAPNGSDVCSVKIGEEHLMFLLPKKHRFAKRKSLTLGEMNGENMLLFSEIGFWADIVKIKMADSRFLVQNERYSFEELITNSVLPCFTSDLVMGQSRTYGDRVAVPIDDPEVNVTYYLVCRKENRKIFAGFFSNL